MMRTISVDDAAGRLSELFEKALDGADVVITRGDGTAMRLVPVRGCPRFGSARGLFTMADDFDAPLDDFGPYER
jgi:antitoxin (DNA-binding transcriptional repressor) of toxin-antitoxin stability system